MLIAVVAACTFHTGPGPTPPTMTSNPISLILMRIAITLSFHPIFSSNHFLTSILVKIFSSHFYSSILL